MYSRQNLEALATMLAEKEAEAKEARDRFVDAARPHATQEDAGELEIETEKA